MDKKIYEFDFRGRKIVVEAGELAKQTNGAVLVRYNDTVILSTVVMNKKVNNLDFFPLMVLYQEKLYSVGKIPGGFIKREGRPSENATLTSRLIDRPIRPLFPEGFNNEVQVVNMALSVDHNSTPDMTALFGSSLALSISDIPFNGPVAGVIVGRVNNEFIINPSTEELELSDISLSVAGTYDAINMVEASSKMVNEEDMLEAILFGHKAIKELIEMQQKIVNEIGKEKMEVELIQLDNKILAEVNELAKEDMLNAIQIKEKLEKYAKIDEVKATTLEKITMKYQDNENIDLIQKQIKMALGKLEKDEIRRLITVEKIRPDGRRTDEIRPLSARVDILPRTHGSGLFTRGQTQVLSTTTLGALNEFQILDGLEAEDMKRFMHHYNFPQFSVGETGRYGAPGRREIGHGALGEKALSQIIPNEDEFPYTIRVVSEVLESNGSSSQASICAGCMSLMAAGVPVKDMVAGIAMGLISDGENYTILTDIQGIEDHEGDMDFKVAGTRTGICALQMDIKIKGITPEILKESLEQANFGRLQILDTMSACISEPRGELSKYAPKIKQMMISPEKIKDVIGRGGENITRIILESSNVKTVNDKDAVKIDIDDDGRVVIYHTNYEIIDTAMKMIEEAVRVVEDGKIYTGKVVKVEDFGCFVELWPGCEGMVHISHLDNKRVEKTSDIVKVGDEIIVKAIGTDKKGRINLSRKEAIQ